MPIPAAFRLCWAPLLISLSLAGCVVSKDYAGPAPEQVLPRLLAVLRDPNPDQRRTAAQALGKIARKEAVPALVEALRDPDAGVRRNAAWALGMIGEDAVGPDRSPLASLLFDPDPGVREAAAMALGLTGDTQAGIELLLERMREPGTPSDSKRLAAAALGEIADPETVAPLSKVLATDPDPGVRVEAAFRLGKFGGEAARPALAAAFKDANADVRRLAEAALKELGG